MRSKTIVVGASRSLFSSRELSGSHYFNQAKLVWWHSQDGCAIVTAGMPDPQVIIFTIIFFNI